MNAKRINHQVRENYGDILNKMTTQEKEWAKLFETVEYATERSKVFDALAALLSLKGVIFYDEDLEELQQLRDVHERCNPQRAESFNARMKKRNKTTRTVTASQYTQSDFANVGQLKGSETKDGYDASVMDPRDRNAASNVASMGKRILKNVNPDQAAMTVNPEDGIIEAIDHARKSNRTLERLVFDAKQSKEAKADVEARLQTAQLVGAAWAMRFAFRTVENVLDWFEIFRTPNGTEWVVDQHKRMFTLPVFLERRLQERVCKQVICGYQGHATTYVTDRKTSTTFKDGVKAV